MEKWVGNRWVTLLILSIGFLLILVDTTIVNVSIPTIIKDLNASLSDIEWVINGYALTFAAFLITFGRLGDMYGRKLFFNLGIFIFILASFFSGEAHSATTLIIARLFQGVGGAMISPSTLSIISANFKGKDRSLAFGIWGAIAGIAVALGPILGGYITTYYSWRWIFRINIPLGIIGIIISWIFIKENKSEKKQKIDYLGMITSAIGFFLIVFALIEGQTYGWWLPNKPFTLRGWSYTNQSISIIPITALLGIIILAIFAWLQYQETKHGDNPTVDFNFLQFKTFRYGLIAIMVIALGEFSSLFTLPIFLQSVRGYTPLQSGLATLPLAVATFIAAPLSAQIVNRVGSKWVISAGIFLESIGLFILSLLTIKSDFYWLIFPLAILGAGIGLAISQNTQVILSEIPPEEGGSASGVLNTIRQVGSALGIAIIGALFASQVSLNMQQNIKQVTLLPDQVKSSIVERSKTNTVGINQQENSFSFNPPPQIASNPQALEQFMKQKETITTQVDYVVKTSITDAIGYSIRIGSLFVLFGALLSLLIPNIKHK